MPYNFSQSGNAGGFNFTAPSGYNFTTGGAGEKPHFLDKAGGFALSTVESFPELLGIEPTEATQTFRAQNPVSGFLSQVAGAFVPYVGAAKLARTAPLTREAIAAVEGLGAGPISRGALGAAAEAGVVEAGRLGISATGLPEPIYEGITGRDAETRPLGMMAGESLVNVGGSAVLGGAIGGLAARFSKGPRIQDLTGVGEDAPLLAQARRANELVSDAMDPANSLTLSDDAVERLAKERNRLIQWNLLDVEPTYTDTGETVRSGKYRQDLGRVFRPLIGERKTNDASKFLNRANNWRTPTPDKLTTSRRLVYDPLERGGYSSEQDFADDLSAIGKAREELGLFAQDIKTIEVKPGSGNKPQPEDYASPLDWIRDKVGRVKDFYHGTASDIDEWTVGSRGGISFSTDPSFSSQWALMKAPFPDQAGARVYVTAIRAAKNKTGNYKNAADVMKAIEAAGLDPANPALQADYASGKWTHWENLRMLRKAGWDTVYMVESPSAGGTLAAQNLFVTNGENIYSAFDPKVRWAKSLRLHATEPQWNKTTKSMLSANDQKASTIQKKFSGKAWADVGEGWKLAKEEDGLYVMAKKIRGGADPAAGDRWVFLRTDRPGFFAERAGRSNEVFMKSAYLPKAEEFEKIGDPVFDAGAQFLKSTEDVPLRKQTRARNAVEATARESAETVGSYLAPTAPLGTRNPLLNRAFQYLKHIESLAEARVDTLMRGARGFHGERSLLRNIATLDAPTSEGLAARIDDLSAKDLADVKFVLESEMPFEQVVAANRRLDINGEALISDKAKDFLQAMQLISDQFTNRVGNLQASVKNQSAMKLVAEFQARKGHYALTREFPGAYRYFLEDNAGHVVGMATGKSPREAQEAAQQIIKDQAAKGKALQVGGLLDEALRNPEELQRLKSAVLRPGFLKNRGDLLGYDLQRGELTNAKLRELVEKNIRRRENYIRNVSAFEQLQETVATLERTRPQDATALKKRIAIFQGDEGEFARVQNALMDKTLHAVGFSGKDSASEIVRATQKVLTKFTFSFGNLSQPILNMLGTLQTIVPEISYVVHASPETLARNYVTFPLLDRGNNVKGNLGILSEWKIFGNAMKAMGTKWKDLPDDHRALIEEMIRQRQLAPRFAEEQFGTEGAILKDVTNLWKDTRSFVKYLDAATDLPITKSEEMNRMMVVNSAYEIAKLANMDFDRMVVFTREMMGKTAFNYSTQDRATLFTTPLGSLAGTFKNWMFHYMANMVKYATGGKEALPALFWQTAATAVIGGSAATPFVIPIADGASQFLTDKKFMELLYSFTGGDGIDERVADGIMYGLPGAMGLSFASQAAAPGANPARDASMIFSFAAFDRMKALSDATKDALVTYRTTGEHPWDDEVVRGELVRALAPRTIYRAMALSENTAVKSLSTTYDVTGPLGLGGALLYAAGLNPVELEKTYEVYNSIKDDQNAQRAMMQELGQTLSQALETGDDRLANRVYMRTSALGLDISSVLRSAEARGKRQEETQLEFAASPEDEEAFSFMFGDEPGQ